MEQIHNFQRLNFEGISDNLPFDIRTIQWMKEKKENKSRLSQSNNHFVIIWITKGSGNCWIDLQKYKIANNCFFFIKPGQLHGLQLTAELEGYVISFAETFLGFTDHDSQSIYRNLYQIIAHDPMISFSDDSKDDMKDITEIMMKEFNNHNLFRADLLQRYFKIFLIYLSRQLEAPLQTIRQPRNTVILQNFIAMVDKKFRTHKMVADYADLLSVTPNYLNEVIKKNTGYSAGYHIRQRVSLEAKRQATYSNICMKKIAYDLGFDDLAHFSKFFKNTTGVNFSDFKKNGQVFLQAS